MLSLFKFEHRLRQKIMQSNNWRNKTKIVNDDKSQNTTSLTTLILNHLVCYCIQKFISQKTEVFLKSFSFIFNKYCFIVSNLK